MSSEQLIEYLKSCWKAFEDASMVGCGDFKTEEYLYFATTQERFDIYAAMKFRSYGYSSSFVLSQMHRNQIDVLALRPHFDAALAKKKITSLTSFRFPRTLENTSENAKAKFIEEFIAVENARGMLNALLTLRNWAYFPGKSKGAKNRQRHARIYLGHVLAQLDSATADREVRYFLRWCGKQSRKILPWESLMRNLRSPPSSALPIHIGEAANYVRHFLRLSYAPKKVLRQHFAEMVVFLSLCLSCARQHSNYFVTKDILKISASSMEEVPVAPQSIFFEPPKDVIENSRPSKKAGGHQVLQLGLSEDFLTDEELWPQVLPTSTEATSAPICKQIRVGDKTVIIGDRLAAALTLMGTFSISSKDVENRLAEAFKEVGLLQSSGGLAPRCFLSNPHLWEGVDLREGGGAHPESPALH